MRKVSCRLVLLAAFALLPLNLNAAKPDYCGDAYRKCVTQCREFPGPLGGACEAGCVLAYLYCGS